VSSATSGVSSAGKLKPLLPTPFVAPRSRRLWNPSTAGSALDVMGHVIANVSLATATQDIVTLASAAKPTRIVFVNAHVVNSAIHDATYRRTVALADIRYADGSGLAIAARIAGDHLADNVNGTDMLPLLAAEASTHGVKLFLLGGVPGAAAQSVETLVALGHAAAIAGSHHGYFDHGSLAEKAVIEAINASGADIVLVGMGVPVQDEWIANNAGRMTAPVLIGVGGLFDFYSGRKSRAPRVLRSLGLEWTWRLALEPGRMWRRYLIGNVTFLTHAAKIGARKRWKRRIAARTGNTVSQ
jgi:exopolysaccharide biosynthesis WecB/TagA/CpsF family protein